MISLRGLNRTLLTRQLLTDRVSLEPVETIRHLVAMQGQEPNWPYIGLWARLTEFQHDDLATLLHDRRAVRSTMLRRTVHIAAADDFRWIRPTVAPIVHAAFSSPYFADETKGLDLAEVHQAGRELLAGRTLTRREFGRLMAERYPGRNGGRLAAVAELMSAMAHGPEAGAWGRWGSPSSVSVTLAEEWSGLPMATAPEPERLVLRYLAAFGPATVMDVQTWAGITRLRAVLEGMRDELRVVRDEEGRELYDLPGAPIADPDQPVPVRFLPAFDNALLGHKDRRRVIGEADRGRYAKVASGGVPMFLVDGFVQGVWTVRKSTLTVAPFRPLPDEDAAAVLAEAGRLRGFIGGDLTIEFIEDGSAPINNLQAGSR
ncbi:winged helix DNA-binding domain-containing protein [Spirillospora sp. NPDC048911]|uniref:winged helix DNA-binding domain-containing protein n=1 Tax=Spirillospora sp. NPDC048911 TaxID=3364527 RepID=UPI003721062B